LAEIIGISILFYQLYWHVQYARSTGKVNYKNLRDRKIQKIIMLVKKYTGTSVATANKSRISTVL